MKYTGKNTAQISFPLGGIGTGCIGLGGNGALLAVYWFVYARYLRERTRRRALTLAVVPACIFLMSGLLLRHWLLVVFALLFAVGHIYVTTQNVA